MSLILPPWYFSDYVDNLEATPATGVAGIAFTLGTSSAEGSVTSMLSALAFDVHFLIVTIKGATNTGIAHHALADVMIDPAGGTAWASFIDDLVCGFIANNAILSQSFLFPIWIPAGTSIGIRGHTAHTAVPVSGTRAVIQAFGNPSRPDMWWCGQKVESLGINAGSKGTDVTPGISGEWGSWTDIGSVTGARFGAIQFGSNGVNATTSLSGYYHEIGYGSARLPGSPKFHEQAFTSEQVGRGAGHQLPVFCDIAAGTQMQVRSLASMGSAETQNVALYGVY